MDAIDRALLHEERVIPSADFGSGVMARVRLDPLQRRGVRFPWAWLLLAVAAGVVCSPWVLFSGGLDPELAQLVAWGAAVTAGSLSLAGLSFELLEL